MTITIKLEPEIEARLEQEARQQGQTVPEFVQTLLRICLSERSALSEESPEDAAKIEEDTLLPYPRARDLSL